MPESAEDLLTRPAIAVDFQEVGSTVAPPPGPPSEAELGRVLEACARHGIEILGQP